MTPKDWPEIMTVEQVAEYLQVVPKTIYRAIDRGDLPAAKLGRVYRIKKSDVESYLDKLKGGVVK